MQVRFTPTGRAQFLDIIRYLRSDNPAAAHKFKENAKRTLKRLARFPNSGRSLPEFPDLPHREVIVKPYRFFYRVVDKVAWVVAVWHSAQTPKRPQ